MNKTFELSILQFIIFTLPNITNAIDKSNSQMIEIHSNIQPSRETLKKINEKYQSLHLNIYGEINHSLIRNTSIK